MIDRAITWVEHLASAGAHSARPLDAEVVELFDSLRVPLLRYLSSIGAPIEEAEEVVQEAFLALFHHLARNGDRQNLRGWLFTVARNQALKRLQQRVPIGRMETAAGLSCPEPNPESAAAFGQQRARMLAVLDALPEQDRSCLSLRAEGLRYREIATVTGMSLGAVAQSLARSLEKLRRVEERHAL